MPLLRPVVELNASLSSPMGFQAISASSLSGTPLTNGPKAEINRSLGAYYTALKNYVGNPASVPIRSLAAAKGREHLEEIGEEDGLREFLAASLQVLEETPNALPAMRTHWEDVFDEYLGGGNLNYLQRLLINLTNLLSPSSYDPHPQADAMFEQLIQAVVGDGRLAKRLKEQYAERKARKGEQPFRMLFVTPEYDKYMKAGGVGTFAGGWAPALNQHWNAWVTIFMPRYRNRWMRPDVQMEPVMRRRGVPWEFDFVENVPGEEKPLVHRAIAYRSGYGAAWAGQPPTYLIADTRNDKHCLTSKSYASDSQDEAMKVRTAAFMAAAGEALLVYLTRDGGEMRVPDLTVMNDWPTALFGSRHFLEVSRLPGGRKVQTLYIVHNSFIYNLGRVLLSSLERFSGLPPDHMHGFAFIHALMKKGKIALQGIWKSLWVADQATGRQELRESALLGLGAILHANLVMGVSRTHTHLMLTLTEMFSGLQDILKIKHRFGALFGVEHGLDPYEGSPVLETPDQRARFMQYRQDVKNLLFEETGLMEQIRQKVRNELTAKGRPTDGEAFEAMLRAELKTPTLGIVSRLDKYQKGFGQLMEPLYPGDPSSPTVLEAILGQGVRIVVHGPTMPGSDDFLEFIQRLSQDPRYRGQVALINDFEPLIENLSEASRIEYDHKLIYKKDLVFTLDGFLLPSREEPYGMTMLEALREGTPPIASTNGGPLDTLGAHDARVHADGMGFLYGKLHIHQEDPAYQALEPHLKEYSAQGLYETIQDWLAIYRQPERWEQVVVNAKNFRRTWKDATREFLEFVIPRVRPDLVGRLLKPIDREPIQARTSA
jgi:glycogen synthase